MRMRSFVLAMATSMLITTASAQQVSMGALTFDAPLTIGDAKAPVTFIDLANPVTANGTIGYVTLRWSRDCGNAVKIKVLRGFDLPLGQFSVVAERGPFNVVNGRFTVALTPPITVLAGDVLAVVQLLPIATCGSVEQSASPDGVTAYVANEVNAPAVTGATITTRRQISAFASTDAANTLTGVIPAVGALAGSNNSFFRTALQLQSVDAQSISGRFVFHPAGKAADPSDPSLAFTVPAVGSLNYSDLITTMGQSGLGSLDIYTNGGAVPVVTARVFNDNGAAGTQGFTEDVLQPADVPFGYVRSTLPLPADPANFRMNIGVRTLSAATVRFNAFTADGVSAATSVLKSYPANYFEQIGVPALLGIGSLPAGGFVYVTVESGTAIVYGSYTDNRTNDSTIKYAGR